MKKMTKPTVFITGANGFIAQHIIRQLLNTNKFKVIGSVRNSAKADKLKKDFHNDPNLSTVIVKDLAASDAFDEVFKKHGANFTYVMHTASPINMNAEDNMNDLILPALNGTKNIMHATINYAPNVKKFILTSSVAAVMTPSKDKMFPEEGPLNEQSWNQMSEKDALDSSISAYCYSKAAAEHAAWDLQHELNPTFSLTTINPGYVLGPQCFASSVSDHLNASCEIINGLVHSHLNDPVSNEFRGSVIDVRDVAKAHVNSLTDDTLGNRRLILAEEPFALQSIVDFLNEKYPQLRGKIAKGEPGTGEDIMKEMPQLDNHISKELLGFKFKDIKESLTATVDQILKFDAKHH